jgi:heme exporter protein A
MKSNSLELIDLHVARDGEVLIHGLTYRIEAGDLLIVRGKNGSGKSTLLKTIAGLIPPAGGLIRLNGEPYNLDTHSRPLYLGHRRGLTPSLSVGDNVRIWSHLAGNDDLYEAALHYFDLEGLEEVPLHTLSAGWQQRAALTRLITIPATLWLLDEPIANLDEEGIELLHNLIQVRKEQGGMILMTSHAIIQGEGIKSINISELVQENEVMH